MYVSLHNRSAYSFGSSLIPPEQLVAFAAHHRMPAIALTDLDGLYGAVAFQQACQKAGVKPIFGVELEIALEPANSLSVVLLAQTLRGYGHLCRLISLRHLRKSPLTPADLCAHADDVICILGPTQHSRHGEACWRSRAVLSTQYSLLREAFANRIYVAFAIHGPDDVPAARRRAAWADALGIPLVATGESRCLYREDMLMLQALASIGTLTLLDRPHPDKPRGDAWHLRPPAEMDRLFARRPDALANTLRIAAQCNVTLDLDRNRFPAFASPDGRTAMAHLRELCVAGCRRRYVDTPPQKGIGGRRPTFEEAVRRLDRELAIIDQVHYAEYFLVFHEIVAYCRSQGIATLARGSAADSLVCYALGVSHACPFRFDLPFDRFVNPERARFSKMADIDLDLPWDQRDQVITWVYERWGHDRVAMIGAPNTFHARAAMVELGKVFGLPPHEIHRATKFLPHTTAWNLAGSIAASPETRDIPVADEPYRTIIAMAGALEGLPRHWAMHPCGLVVSPEPITDLVPVQRSPKGPLVAQYDMDAIEDLGFIKIDLLGQAGLSVLRDTVAEITRTGTVPISPGKQIGLDCCALSDGQNAWRNGDCPPPEQTTADTAPVGWAPPTTKGDRTSNGLGLETPNGTPSVRQRLPLSRSPAPPLSSPPLSLNFDRDVDYSDPATWDLIAGGQARGVHHIESPAMTSLIVQCNCRDIDCLTSIVALIRPGAANQGKKEAFCRRHQGFEPPTYAHPAIVPVLESTYGLMVFEEHILQIAVEFASMNLGRADVLRRALNKENRPLIEEMKIEFRESALRRGHPQAEIDAVWQVLDDFSGFMFNKAHSAEYAVEAFQGAWLKVRWPAHYLAAILSNYRGFYAHSPTLPQILYIMEALRLGIRMRPPCVNRSRDRFCVEYLDINDAEHATAIRVPIAHIHGLPAEFAARWWAERQRSAFRDLADFIARCRPGPAEAQLLLDSGALDCFAETSKRQNVKTSKECDETAEESENCRHNYAGRPALFWQLRLGDKRATRHVTKSKRASTAGDPDSQQETSASQNVTNSKRILAGDPVGESLSGRTTSPQFLAPDAQLDFEPDSSVPLSPPVALTAPDTRAVAQREMELLGFPITLDPLTLLGGDDKGRQIDWSQYVPVCELGRYLGRRVRVCGLMVADRINATIKGDLMKFVTLADRTGFVETMLFPDGYKQFGHLTVAHPILAAAGIVESFENGHGFTLRVTALSPPTTVRT